MRNYIFHDLLYDLCTLDMCGRISRRLSGLLSGVSSFTELMERLMYFLEVWENILRDSYFHTFRGLFTSDQAFVEAVVAVSMGVSVNLMRVANLLHHAHDSGGGGCVRPWSSCMRLVMV